MLQKKFLVYSWRNPHWKKVKLNFLFGFWKADLSGTCWAPEEHVSRPSTFVFSVLSSHHFALLLHQDFVGSLAAASSIIQANAYVTPPLSNTVAIQITV